MIEPVHGYFDRLRQAARSRRSQLCVCLDPDPERIPGGSAGALRHCADVILSTAEHACCYKPNAAFWEQYGPDGIKALIELREYVPSDVPLLLDAKRGDIGSTMRAYGRAVFGVINADAVTVNPYLGADPLEEFTRYSNRGIYVLCHTSNPGADDLQRREADGVPLYIHTARMAERLNSAGNVGLVVGATAPEELASVRAESRLPFLIPGVGAQGGDLDRSVRAAWTGDEASCLVAVGRTVLYAEHPASEAAAIQAAINAILARV
jgi:orotidine-5'-phosphate decarboxylase